MRKSAPIAALGAEASGRISVTDAHVNEALDELLDEESVLTRILLGGSVDDGSRARPGTEWLFHE